MEANPASGTGSEGSIDYDFDITHPKISPAGDIEYGAMKFPRDSNPNGLAPELHQDGDGTWLRLAVAKGAYTKASGGSPNTNDRCELRDGKLPLGTPVIYSFDLRAERGFPEVEARCVCAQIKAPYYDLDNGSPLIALRIDRGRYVATVEHLYEPKDAPIDHGAEVSRYLSPYPGVGGCRGSSARAFDHHVFPNDIGDFQELQVRAVLAADSRGLPSHLETEFLFCSSGVILKQEATLPDDIYEWCRFTVMVAPTAVKDEDGVVQLFVGDPRGNDQRLVATANGEFGHAGYPDPKVNTGPPPGEGLQYFKLGPYRDKWNIWGDATAAIHVRNVKRRSWTQGSELREAANR